MIRLIFEAWAWGLSAGLLGVVYINILSKEETFNFWWRIGAKYEGKKWYWKPVWGCAHCFAGQFALWTYFLYKIVPPTINVIRLKGFFYTFSALWLKTWFLSVFGLLIVCAVAIFTAKVISWHFVKKSI